MTLYRFDKKLRIMLFNEIEKIEVTIRSILANVGCQELGDKYWITEAEHFANAEKFSQTLTVIEKELASSKEEYIEHFRHNYIEDYPPAWMITEVLSFGNLNYIYSNIANNRLRKLIADYFGLKPQVFTSSSSCGEGRPETLTSTTLCLVSLYHFSNRIVGDLVPVTECLYALALGI